MRVSIREQLALLVIFAVLIALAIVSVPTWFFVHDFVTDVEFGGLSLTASLKASRIDSALNLLGTISQSVATRLLLQQALVNFYNDNATDPFADARSDLESALSTNRVTGLLQARLYSRNQTGAKPGGLLNVTGGGVGSQLENILLPYLTPDGARVNLSDTEYGYPPTLYPNVTYQDLGYPNPYVPSTPAVAARAFPGSRLSDGAGLLLGPLMINETFALMSLTVPVRSINIQNFVLGYMTLIVSAASLIEVQVSREGLGSTGMVLIVGPDNPSNHFIAPVFPANQTYTPNRDALSNSTVHFVLPPITPDGQPERHLSRDYVGGEYASHYTLSQYPGAFEAFYDYNSQPNNARALFSSQNEQGVPVAVGVARPRSALVDWAVVIEKAESEAYEPIATLQKILLASVLGTAGLAIVVVFPCAHFSVRPIRRLKTATESSINPPGYQEEFDDYDESSLGPGDTANLSSASAKGFFASICRKLKKPKRALTESEIDNHRRIFKIPGRVPEKKHFITDELTELTGTYNEMTDELVKQYASLDEKVAERTRELEISKKAAEAANESKTLFIANISHELKTPLNGIMGICAVCMEDNDVLRIQHSLKTLYRSGELLLHLLEDLLSFSKNQISQQIKLEDKEFCLGELRSQILSIFEKQAQESNIAFNVTFLGYENGGEAVDSLDGTITSEKQLPALGPPGMGRLRGAYLWGDQHRILQVIINLVSNSLKFTPAGGTVQLRIRCVGEVEPSSGDGKPTRTNSARGGRGRLRRSSGSPQSSLSKATTASNAMEGNGNHHKVSRTKPHVQVRERSPTPPHPNAKPYVFEFEVEDTGRGIPKDMQQKVFEPFVQVDSSLSKKYGGTGLGLSICAQLAKLMGGSVSVRSTEGVGSVFSLRIPLRHVKDRAPSTASSSTTMSRPPSPGSTNGGSHRNSLGGGGVVVVAQEAGANTDTSTTVCKVNQPRLVGLSTPFFAPNPAPPDADRGREKGAQTKVKPVDAAADADADADAAGKGDLRVLVADDNSTNIEVVSRMLRLEKVHNVTIAKDGQEAYELVKANMQADRPFDLILMDIQMPNLDGLQSTRLIREMGYAAPIVALTAFSEESNIKECMESGMDEFLSKPIRRPALKKVLTKFATIPEEGELAT
ncbi:uncharacterized protein UV8b_03379 [Ustilaginoidea virens]|uniref:histidine kinase n=1 Tax=Ustilaginoidea virens TaxID=1159556 RepID=A0A063BMY8_USTVR|nr:uncharacterized protein UV8b_03379 [Ustilaginoidea virens]QUC19138.1 hypothetical protein UV8b_03379 [Ustilaginoidea virens]GAO18635.1 hypothetical protein UVI_02058710 [Ustilaginoidea virens]